MDGFNPIPVTLRLRHLTAIKCRNISPNLPDASPVRGVFFAISSVEPENIGYDFISPISKFTRNPEWEYICLSEINNRLTCAEGVIFTFFLEHSHSNTIVFEMNVTFSGLIPFGDEHFDHEPSRPNEVYFQFNNAYYGSPDYYTRESCRDCLTRRTTLNIPYKLSYDLESLERLMAVVHVSLTQSREVDAAKKSINSLEEFLSPVLDSYAERENMLVQISLLRQQIQAERSRQRDIRSRLSKVAESTALIAKQSKMLSDAEAQLHLQADLFSRAVVSKKDRLAKLSHVVSLRTAVLLNETLDIFLPELVRHSPHESLTLRQVCENNGKSTIGPSSHHHSLCQQPHASPPVRLPESLQDSHSSGISLPEPDAVSAAVSLGTVALLLELFAAMLNVPLRHPLDLTEGMSKARIFDSFASDLMENGDVFPLYVARSSVLPAYKYAVFLLNQNLSALRAICDLPNANEESAVWNVVNLLQLCIRNRSQLRLV